jgi:hypothetical protein
MTNTDESNSNFATENTEDMEENCRGLIYQALSLKNLPVGFDESNPCDRIHLTRVGYFVIFAAGKNKMRIAASGPRYCTRDKSVLY